MALPSHEVAYRRRLQGEMRAVAGDEFVWELSDLVLKLRWKMR